MTANEAARLPSPLLKFLYKLPLHLYRLGLGRLLGRRFIWLHHTGRISGLPRENVLEVADYDAKNDIYYVVSGYGKKAQWYRNLLATPTGHAQVAGRRFNLKAEPLSPAASGQFLVDYAVRHPRVIRGLTTVLGLPPANTLDEYRQLGETILPAIALHVTAERPR